MTILTFLQNLGYPVTLSTNPLLFVLTNPSLLVLSTVSKSMNLRLSHVFK